MKRWLSTVLLASLAAACATAATPDASPSMSREALAPSTAVSTVPSVQRSSEPASSSSPVPAGTPALASLAGLEPNVRDTEVFLAASRTGDVAGSRIPELTVYGDGTVLFRQDAGPEVARLTAQGVGSLERLILDAGFLSMASTVPFDPSYAGGAMSYVIILRHDGSLVRRATSNAPAPSHRAEADVIIALVERVVDIEHVLPISAWSVPPAAAVPYVPSKLVFKVTTYDNPFSSSDPNHPTLDVAAVKWPFATPMLRFGSSVPEPPLGSGSASRCAVVTLPDAARIVEAVALAPWSDQPIPKSERMSATLTWKAADSSVDVSLGVLLPDEPDDCAVDGTWP